MPRVTITELNPKILTPENRARIAQAGFDVPGGGEDDSPPPPSKQSSGKLGGKIKASARQRRLNKTEERFMRDRPDGGDGELIAQKLVLPLGVEDTYRPDFLRGFPGSRRTCIEIKGGHVGRVAWSREGIQKFRRARDLWCAEFDFELWQWKDGKWRTG